MQRQHETMQIGAIAPDNPEIEFGDDPLALRRFPTLAPIERHLRAQVQVLNHNVLVALVARAGCRGGGATARPRSSCYRRRRPLPCPCRMAFAADAAAASSTLQARPWPPDAQPSTSSRRR